MKRVFDFMRTRVVMLILSVLVIAGLITGSFVRGGFNLGIDFEAGLSLTVEIGAQGDVTVAEVRDALQGYEGMQIQRSGDPVDNRFVIQVRDDGTTEDFQRVMTNSILEDLDQGFEEAPIRELQVNYVGPRFSEDLTRQAIWLTLFALVLILAYLWFRFRFGYAIASIAALVHDVALIMGVIGTFQLEVSTATIAAVLTIIGYSLNDTIVIFDRIRENESLLRDSSFRTIINTSITQSLSRTVITSVTTLLAVTAIYIFSTGQIELFALKLIVGVVVGTYSSVFVASPVLLTWHTAAMRRRKRKDMEKYHKGAIPRTSEGKAPEPAATAKPQEQAARTAADVEAVKREVAKQRSKKKHRKSK